MIEIVRKLYIKKKITGKINKLDRKLPVLKTIMRHSTEARNNGIMSSEKNDWRTTT